jgi:hypothetical protein
LAAAADVQKAFFMSVPAWLAMRLRWHGQVKTDKVCRSRKPNPNPSFFSLRLEQRTFEHTISTFCFACNACP